MQRVAPGGNIGKAFFHQPRRRARTQQGFFAIRIVLRKRAVKPCVRVYLRTGKIINGVYRVLRGLVPAKPFHKQIKAAAAQGVAFLHQLIIRILPQYCRFPRIRHAERRVKPSKVEMPP